MNAQEQDKMLIDIHTLLKEHIAHFGDCQRACREEIHDLKVTVYGNSHPGIKSRVQTLEEAHQSGEKHRGWWKALAISLAAASVTLVGNGIFNFFFVAHHP